MKKILVVISMLALIPTASMAAGLEFQFGVTGFYNQLITDRSDTNVEYNQELIDDFTYGLDARLSWSILQVSALGLFTPGSATYDEWNMEYIVSPYQIELYLDIGLKFDVFMFSFGFGVGPNFIFKIWPTEEGGTTTDTYDAGANMKLFVDLNLGRLTFSVTYLMILELDAFGGSYVDATAQALAAMEGYIGISLLYKF
jgi:hypothetical protein